MSNHVDDKTIVALVKQGFYVKKTTLYLAVAIAFVIGVFSGFLVKQTSTSTVNKREVSAPQNQSQDPQLLQMALNLEERVKINPNNVENWTNLGNTYFDLGEHNNAIRAYKKSLELAPNNPNVLTDLGVMYRRTNKFTEALKSFNAAIKADGMHEVSRFNKGIVLYFDLDQKQEAITAWEGLLKINPNANIGGQPVKDFLEEKKKELNQ